MTIDIIALSDAHLRSTNPMGRKDSLPLTQFKKFRFIFDYAKKHNCIILQAGDLLNQSRDWDMIIALLKFFKEFASVDFYCVQGQHDNYYHSLLRSTTLGVLERIKYIKILNHNTPQIINGWNIWGSSWKQALPEKAKKSERNILVIHKSIYPRGTHLYPGQKFDDAERFLKNNSQYKLIIVGDIHRPFFKKVKGDRFIVNTGPMLRAEATAFNIDHHKPHFYHFTSFNTSFNYKKITIPHEEAFKILSRTHIDEREDLDVDIEQLASIIENASIGEINRTLILKVLEDNSLRPRIRSLMKEIYQNASG